MVEVVRNFRFCGFWDLRGKNFCEEAEEWI
jgi:hypothetical protein